MVVIIRQIIGDITRQILLGAGNFFPVSNQQIRLLAR
jgi:hypothetical protein